MISSNSQKTTGKVPLIVGTSGNTIIVEQMDSRAAFSQVDPQALKKYKNSLEAFFS